MEFVFATKNQGKLKEIRAFFSDLKSASKNNIVVKSALECGVDSDVLEDGKTFEENALKKAREIGALCGRMVIAEDAGLEIDYLDRAPGVYSARYLGEDTSYDFKNSYILKLLEGVPEEKRTARYVSVFAAVFPDGRELLARDTIEGIIGYEQRGTEGFGYDPIFFVPSLEKTLAEISIEEKNKISHRGKAIAKMKEKLSEIMENFDD